MRNRRTWAIAASVAALTVVAARHPNPAIRLLTHDIGDPRPHRVQAAIDLGLVGISILYTWSGRAG